MSVTTTTDPPSPSPRRITTPGWFDLRLVAGVVLVLASVIIGARVVSGAGQTYDAVAADRPLAAGKRLTAGDLRLVQVRLPDRGRDIYASSMKAVLGLTLSHAVARGELVPLAALVAAPSGTTLTVPLDSGAAPDLHPGDRIELFLSAAGCSSLVLLRSVTVQSVRRDSGGSFGAGGSGQEVVISVPSELAGRIVSALAIDQAEVRAGVLGTVPTSDRTDGPSTPAPSTPAPSSQPTSAQPLPDLALCAGTDTAPTSGPSSGPSR